MSYKKNSHFAVASPRKCPLRARYEAVISGRVRGRPTRVSSRRPNGHLQPEYQCVILAGLLVASSPSGVSQDSTSSPRENLAQEPELTIAHPLTGNSQPSWSDSTSSRNSSMTGPRSSNFVPMLCTAVKWFAARARCIGGKVPRTSALRCRA